MDNIFVVWTPLHVMNVLNLIVNHLDGKNNEIIILNDLPKADRYKEVLSLVCPNLNVTIADAKKLKHESVIKKNYYLLSNRDIFNQKEYQNLYIPGDTFFTRLLFSIGKKKNPRMKLNYFEDGIGAYIYADIINEVNIFDTLQCKLNPHSIFNYSFDTAFVYHPQYADQTKFKDIQKIPAMDDRNPSMAYTRKVFDMVYERENIHINKSTIVYFDQPFWQDGSGICEKEVFEKFLQIIDRKDTDILIKMHPRSEEGKYQDVDILQTELPWEIFMLLNQNLPIIPVGINSTAIFSPTLIFGALQPAILLASWLKNTPVTNLTEKSIKILNNTIGLVENLSIDSIYLPQDTNQLLNSIDNTIKMMEEEYEIET